ncbi:MFS transporter [Herbaspirillum huttiense]|uniref:MFS transporter n=1 Tax=Herbaspirillum huttiense TaxID=863372 RepID=UPI0031E18A51
MSTSTAALGTVPETTGLYRKITFKILPFLLICYFFAYLDRVNVAFAKLQMAQHLQFSDAVYGLGAGIFFIGYFIFEVPSNLIMERVGAKRWISRIMVTWGLLSAGMAFVTTAEQFYVVRFLLGAAEAGFFPGVLLYLSYWFPPAQRGRAISLLMVAVPVSSVIGSPLSGLLMEHMNGFHAMHGWQWLFLVEGVPAVGLGILCLFMLKDKVADAKWLSSEEKATIKAQLAQDDSKKATHSFSAALASGRLWHLAFLYFCIALGNLGVTFWLPSLLRDAGVQSTSTIGWLAAIPFLFSAIVMVLVGRSADARAERRYHLAIPMVVGALGLVLASWMPNLPLLILMLTIATAGLTTALPMFWPLPSAILGGSAMAGGLAVLNSAGALAGFVGPSAIGYIRMNFAVPSLPLWLMAGIVLIGALTVASIPKSQVNR